jgi:hypothetical protein
MLETPLPSWCHEPRIGASQESRAQCCGRHDTLNTLASPAKTNLQIIAFESPSTPGIENRCAVEAKPSLRQAKGIKSGDMHKFRGSATNAATGSAGIIKGRKVPGFRVRRRHFLKLYCLRRIRIEFAPLSDRYRLIQRVLPLKSLD